MPVVQRQAREVGHVEHARFVHPAHQWVVRLRGQVHQHAALRLFDGGFDDVVERLVAVHHHGAGVARVETQQRTVRAVGVEADEVDLVVDEVLRLQARQHRLAHTALLAADEVDLGLRLRFQGRHFHGGFRRLQ